MTIIEALKKAESGHSITNGILEIVGKFYKYRGHGYFDLYIDQFPGPLYLETISAFSFGEILATDWKIIEIDWKHKKPAHE